MEIWASEIKELEKLYESLKGQLPELEKELEHLVKADDENVILLYSRRCLEVIITDLCECELKRPRKTEPLKGIIDKLHKEEKVPSHIITSMHGLNELSTYGAHPKDFDPEQIKPVLNNLDIIIKWYFKYKDLQITGKAEEVKSEIKQWTVSPPEKSIIVLPFENISPDPDQEYFSDGLTEEIITDLSHIHDLLVISRSSAMTFKGTKKTIPEIAQVVKVRYVLEGSVRKAGNNIRITAQLIDSMTDAHLWAEKYNGTLDNIFEIQEKVSRSIVEALKIKLNPEEQKIISEVSIANIKAYEYYFKAKQAMGTWTESELNQAEQLLLKGLELAGKNTLLFSQLGYINYQYWNIGYRIDEKYLEKTSEFINSIFSIEPNSIHGYFLKGILEMTGGDAKKSISYLHQVLRIDPNHPDALFWICWNLGLVGKAEYATPYYEKLIKVDPLNVVVKSLHYLMKMFDGEPETLLEPIRQLYQANREFIGNQWLYIMINVYLSKHEEAISAIDLFMKETPQTNLYYKLFNLLKSALLGKKSELKFLDTNLEKWAKKDVQYSFNMAQCFSLIKENEKAIDWLENSINLGGINYPNLNKYDPLLENIRGEERFKKLIERVKYEWENFQV